MINRIVIGTGNNRKVFDLERDEKSRYFAGKDLLDFITNPAKLDVIKA